jgi:hypothetical protein
VVTYLSSHYFTVTTLPMQSTHCLLLPFCHWTEWKTDLATQSNSFTEYTNSQLTIRLYVDLYIYSTYIFMVYMENLFFYRPYILGEVSHDSFVMLVFGISWEISCMYQRWQRGGLDILTEWTAGTDKLLMQPPPPQGSADAK